MGIDEKVSVQAHTGGFMKGILIVIDGTDGSGKKTQSELLIRHLEREGYAAVYFDFPQHGKPSAALVDEYLNGKFGKAHEVAPKAASIFYAADRYAASFDIRAALGEGKIVVCDRYVSANQGHQAGKISDIKERDAFLAWLDELEFGIFGIPRPDINILLYLPPVMGQILVDRKQLRAYIGGNAKRDIHENDLGHLNAAANAFLYCAKKYQWTVINCNSGDAFISKEDIHEKVWEAVQPQLPTTEFIEPNLKNY